MQAAVLALVFSIAVLARVTHRPLALLISRPHFPVTKPSAQTPDAAQPVTFALGSPLRPGVSEANCLNPQHDLSVKHLFAGRLPVVLVEGGVASTRRSPHRCGVKAFVAQSGANAGLNGVYFADAMLKGTDNHLIGPTLCANEHLATLDAHDRNQTLTGRPLVLLSPHQTRIVSYDPATMDTEDALRKLLPGVTDVFLGGAWLVHRSIAASRPAIDRFHVHDAEDTRRRAFFAVLSDGQPALGATAGVSSSARLAHGLPALGISEAVLLDSGFSTSLVVGSHVLVTGHTSPGLPSRPVPHALVLFTSPSRRAALALPASHADASPA